MSTPKITPAKNLDVQNIQFSKVFTDSNNRKTVFLNQNGNKGTILVATDKVYFPSGIQRIRKKDAVNSDDDSYVLNIGLQKEDPLYQKLSQLDQTVTSTATKNQREWKLIKDDEEELNEGEINRFKYKNRIVKSYTNQKAETYYSAQLRLERDYNQEHKTFSGKFLASKKNGGSELLVYDGNTTNPGEHQIPLNESNFEQVVPKGSSGRCLFEIVYVSIGAFVSVKLRVVQIEVCRSAQAVQGYAMPPIEGSPESFQAPAPQEPGDELPDDLDTETPETVEEDAPEEVEVDVDVKVEEVKPKKKRATTAK